MKINRILLVHPPGNRVVRANGERGLKAAVQPLGLAYLAAVLRKYKYEVAILDCIIEGYDDGDIEVEPEIFRYGLTDQKIAFFIEDFKPDVVAISCPHTVRQHEANRVAAISKKILPNVPVVMGGASPSALKQELLIRERTVDYIMQGEGETSLPQLLEALQSTSPEVSKVAGLIFRQGDGFIANALQKKSMDIDSIPLPAYDLLPMKKYLILGKNPSVHSSTANTSIMISSRGCSLQCYYCPVHNVFGSSGPSFRMRSIENVLKEIELLSAQYGVREIQFEDANFNASPERTIALSNAIGKRFPGLRWCTPHGNQLSTLTPRVLEAMRRGGCYSLHLAVESGNQEFLDKRKKSVQLSKLDEVLKESRQLGFDINAFLMIGYPEENREDIQRTIDFAMTLDIDDVHFFIATPFPGTEMYRICMERGWIAPEISWRHFRYSIGVIRTDHFDPPYLQKVRRSAWLAVRKKIEASGSSFKLSELEGEVY